MGLFSRFSFRLQDRGPIRAAFTSACRKIPSSFERRLERLIMCSAMGAVVLVFDEGRIAQDVAVNVARPRARGSAELAGLEASILSHLLSAEDRT
jgi:hypothetical protein